MIRLRELREAQFLTQADLSKQAGIGVATIVRIEQGQVTPNPKTIRKLAAALGVEPTDLVPDPAALAAARRRRPRRKAPPLGGGQSTPIPEESRLQPRPLAVETIGELFQAMGEHRCPTVPDLAGKLNVELGPPLLDAIGVTGNTTVKWAAVMEQMGDIQDLRRQLEQQIRGKRAKPAE